MIAKRLVQHAIMIDDLGINTRGDIDAQGEWWLTSSDGQGSMNATPEGAASSICEAWEGCWEAFQNGFALDGWSLDVKEKSDD